MAITVVKLAETGYEGQYIIDTADAYRGCAVYVSGINSDGVYKVNIPSSSALAARCEGIVTKYYLNDTGSDTADAVDKLTKGSRVVVLRGPGIFKITGGAVDGVQWSSAYWLGGNLATAAQRVATAQMKHAFISLQTGKLGRWTASSINNLTKWGKANIVSHTASQYFGPRFKVLDLIGSTSKGISLMIDVDWNRFGQVAYTPPSVS